MMHNHLIIKHLTWLLMNSFLSISNNRSFLCIIWETRHITSWLMSCIVQKLPANTTVLTKTTRKKRQMCVGHFHIHRLLRTVTPERKGTKEAKLQRPQLFGGAFWTEKRWCFGSRQKSSGGERAGMATWEGRPGQLTVSCRADKQRKGKFTEFQKSVSELLKIPGWTPVYTEWDPRDQTMSNCWRNSDCLEPCEQTDAQCSLRTRNV